MPITTVNVLCTAYLQNAGVFEGRIRAKLNNMYATYNGIVLPDTVHSVKFTDGTATLKLVPNSQFTNSTGSYYTVTLEERFAVTDGYNTAYEYKPVQTTHIIVPNTDCNLSDIVALPPTKESPAIAQAFASKAAASASSAAQSASYTSSAVSAHNADASAHSVLMASYTPTTEMNTAISSAISLAAGYTASSVSAHSVNISAHQDIRDLIGHSQLPLQSGHSGKVLTTDGNSPLWATMSGLPPQSGQSGKCLMSDGSSALWGMVDVSGSIASHNENASAHSDIRTAVSGKVDSAYVSSYVSGEVSGLVASSAMSSYVSGAISGLADSAYVSSAVSGLASSSYVSSYVSGEVSGLASSSYVSSAVSAHNVSSSAHSDIRTAISGILPAQSGQSGKVLGTDGTSPLWTSVSGSDLPSQSGHSGHYLSTNGSSAGWSSVQALPSQSGQSGKFLTTNGTEASWAPVSTMATVTDTLSTMIALPTAAANTNYSYGELISLALGFSASGSANDAVHIMFKSGATATTLTVDGTNALFGSFTPNTNAVVEIDARYYVGLSKWVVLFSQVATA